MRQIHWIAIAVCATGCAPLEGPGTESLLGETYDSGDPSVEDQDGDGADDENDDGDKSTSPEDDALLVSVDLPTALNCGETYEASVEMKNTGTVSWTRDDGYKLGAVNDEDSLYGPDVRVWLSEGVTVEPGESHVFEFDLTAPQAGGDYVTDWQMVHESVQWFGESTTQTVAVSCSVQTVCDSLTSSTTQTGFSDKAVQGGSFSSSGWQTTGNWDQILLKLTTPISGDGTLEIDVTNFDPTTQYGSAKHQIINMYTSDDGSQAVFETDEAWWNIRTGTNYGTGFKLLAAGNGGDSREEVRLIETATWNPSDVHTFTVTWGSEALDIYLDGSYLETLSFNGRAQPLQHIFIGKDNVYEGQVGPIYSNVCVTY